MKQLVASRTLAIPDGVSIEVKARKVRVKGPRGESVSVNMCAMQHIKTVAGAPLLPAVVELCSTFCIVPALCLC